MATVQTRDFGELPCDPSAELAFPLGIPGFEDQRRFVLIELPALSPVVLLQSLETSSLCFLAIAVSVLDSGYRSGIAPEDLQVLGLDENRQPWPDEEALFMAILSPSADGTLTANLLAPVVVNLRTRVGLQAVRSDRLYSHRHPLSPAPPERPCS
ncbi:MAG TPA: flagellar assembly protein FliW [Bryobacteraceae bacterium]|nr:flagellar assembly protein FliW [Bryobacteraceae bacterium]